MGYAKIVALDLGNIKTVSCLMEPADHSHGFETIAMSPASMHELIARHLTSNPAETLVVMETCDCCSWVHDLCTALGASVMVVSAHGEAWQWRRVKRKTDRDDALKLARLAVMNQLTAVHMPEPRERQRRRLILHRRSIVSRRTQCRNSIRAIFRQQGIALAKGNKQWTQAGLAQLREQARPIERCDDMLELWRGRLHAELEMMSMIDQQLKPIDAKLDELGEADARIQLCQTIKGVGPRTAEAVVTYLGDVTRFKNADHVAGYAGLVPKQLQSGEMNRYGHITHRGPGLLRSMLVEAAWMVYRLNDWARAWVQKISRGSKGRRKLAMVALARKLLTMLWSMLKHNQPFRDPLSAPARTLACVT